MKEMFWRGLSREAKVLMLAGVCAGMATWFSERDEAWQPPVNPPPGNVAPIIVPVRVVPHQTPEDAAPESRFDWRDPYKYVG